MEKTAALKRILVRSLVLYCFGLLVYGGISKGIGEVRWMGVLQRIAISYFFTGVLFCISGCEAWSWLAPRCFSAIGH